jgi:hypothetical protein
MIKKMQLLLTLPKLVQIKKNKPDKIKLMEFLVFLSNLFYKNSKKNKFLPQIRTLEIKILILMKNS